MENPHDETNEAMSGHILPAKSKELMYHFISIFPTFELRP